MNQLETAGTRPATWLPCADLGSTEPQFCSQASPDGTPPGKRNAEPEPTDSILYASPPPMPWPRVFPGL